MNTLTDVMNYFHFVMIAVYVLGGITVITTVANIKKKNCRTVILADSFEWNCFHKCELLDNTDCIFILDKKKEVSLWKKH